MRPTRRKPRPEWLFLLVPCVLMACSSDPGTDGGTVDGAPTDGTGQLDARYPDGAPILPDGTGMDGGGGGGDGGMDSTVGPDVPFSDGGVVVNPDATVIHLPDGGTGSCYVITCRSHMTACGDCVDNDGDGLIDQYDPECLGPCSDSEGPTLFPAVGGGTSAACTMNCYFNFGIGSGSDDCHWDHRCDPLAVPPNFYPQGDHCPYEASRVDGRTCPNTQSTTCLNNCMPLTPNGCDCFGCCTFPELAGRGPGGTDGFVYLGSLDTSGNPSCTFAGVNNPALCHPCTPSRGCYNPCGPCEVCIGGHLPDPARCNPMGTDAGTPTDSSMTLPDGFVVHPDVVTPPDSGTPPDGGGMSTQCPAGIQACGLPGQGPCPMSYYCITGCCEYIPG